MNYSNIGIIIHLQKCVIFFLNRLLKYHEISLAGKVIFMEKTQNKLKINYKVWYLHNEYERKENWLMLFFPTLEKNLELLSET